jgi:hypothetical protein
VLFPLAIYFVYFQFSFFQSLRDFDFFQYLIQRIGFISVEPLVHIFYDRPHLELVTPFAFVHDLIYPIFKIFGLEYLATNTQVSQSLFGLRLSDFSVPVTYTYVGYTMLEFGIYGGVVAAFGFGVATALVYYYTQAQQTANARGAMISLEYFVVVGLTSGNMFYLLPNCLFVIMLFIVMMNLFTRTRIR